MPTPIHLKDGDVPKVQCRHCGESLELSRQPGKVFYITSFEEGQDRQSKAAHEIWCECERTLLFGKYRTISVPMTVHGMESEDRSCNVVSNWTPQEFIGSFAGGYFDGYDWYKIEVDFEKGRQLTYVPEDTDRYLDFSREPTHLHIYVKPEEPEEEEATVPDTDDITIVTPWSTINMPTLNDVSASYYFKDDKCLGLAAFFVDDIDEKGGLGFIFHPDNHMILWQRCEDLDEFQDLYFDTLDAPEDEVYLYKNVSSSTFEQQIDSMNGAEDLLEEWSVQAGKTDPKAFVEDLMSRATMGVKQDPGALLFIPEAPPEEAPAHMILLRAGRLGGAMAVAHRVNDGAVDAAQMMMGAHAEALDHPFGRSLARAVMPTLILYSTEYYPGVPYRSKLRRAGELMATAASYEAAKDVIGKLEGLMVGLAELSIEMAKDNLSNPADPEPRKLTDDNLTELDDQWIQTLSDDTAKVVRAAREESNDG